MNHERVTAILRELAATSTDEATRELFAELADAFAEEPARGPRTRPRNVRRPRTMARPSGEASPDVRRRAAQILAQYGFR